MAGVFTDEGTYLFVDGRKVWNSTPCTPESDDPFLIGGTDTSVQFLGQIRCVRISRGERFSEAFTPDHDFAPDESTVLIYEGKIVNGLEVMDVSGSGNAGRWIESATETPIVE